jgi:general secretion pathway protein F
VPTFAYRALDASGRKQRGTLQSATVKQARDLLAQRGLFVERISPSRSTAVRVGLDQRAILYREMGALIQAGMTMVKTLEVLEGSSEFKGAAPLLCSMREGIEHGSTLAEVVAGTSLGAKPFEISAIQAGERAGQMTLVLNRLADYLEAQFALREKIRSALTYPTVVLVFGVIVAVLMLAVLIPRVEQMLLDNDGKIPPITRFMVGLGGILLRWGWLVVVALIMAVVVIRIRLRSAAFKQRFHGLLYRLPLVGGCLGVLTRIRFASTFAMLSKAGVPVVDAVRMGGTATGNAWCEAELLRQSEAIRQGTSVAAALGAVPPLGRDLLHWVEVGEAGGDLAGMLENAAVRQLARWERLVDRAVALLEPILLFIIGGFVLLIALSVILPMLSLSRSLG